MGRQAEPKQVQLDNGEEKKIRWKYIGGASFWLGKHIMKPGQIFQAFPSEIPAAFRDVIKPIDGIEEPPKKIIAGKVATFTKVIRDEKGDADEDLYDVVNEKGKKLNGKGLTSDLADEFLKDLQS
jgi:hypothetical protein